MIKIPNTLQEVFNIVSAHLLTQIKRSIAQFPDKKYPSCVYRGENGMKCAAGVLIPDDQYNPKFENQSWTILVEKHFVEDKFSREIYELQKIHDLNRHDDINFLKEQLIEFARTHDLTHNIEV